MDYLNTEVKFLGLPDDTITDDILLTQFEKIKKDYHNLKIVYAPMIERGNVLHDMCGRIAAKVFNNVLHYSTYTKDRPYPKGDIIVKTNSENTKQKYKTLGFYRTQKDKPEDKIYFDES